MARPYPHPTSPAVTAVMKGNRRVGTKPEAQLRSALHARGLRFRKDFAIRLGDQIARPDIVFPRRRVAVFVDGCFWHSCPEHGHVPGGLNADYWQRKLGRNVDRDRRDTETLLEAGWVIIRIWEHTPTLQAADRVEEAWSRQGGGLRPFR